MARAYKMAVFHPVSDGPFNMADLTLGEFVDVIEINDFWYQRVDNGKWIPSLALSPMEYKQRTVLTDYEAANTGYMTCKSGDLVYVVTIEEEYAYVICIAKVDSGWIPTSALDSKEVVDEIMTKLGCIKRTHIKQALNRMSIPQLGQLLKDPLEGLKNEFVKVNKLDTSAKDRFLSLYRFASLSIMEDGFYLTGHNKSSIVMAKAKKLMA